MSTGLVTLAAGADKGEVQGAISTALADHPDAQVLDQEGFEKRASGFIDQLLTFVTVMLLLAVADRPARHRQHAGAVGVRADP